MENLVVEPNETVTEKIVRVPGQVETVLVEGEKGLVEAGSLVVVTSATVGHDLVKGVEHAGEAVVAATNDGVSDLVQSSKQMGRDVRQAVHPAPTPA